MKHQITIKLTLDSINMTVNGSRNKSTHCSTVDQFEKHSRKL